MAGVATFSANTVIRIFVICNIYKHLPVLNFSICILSLSQKKNLMKVITKVHMIRCTVSPKKNMCVYCHMSKKSRVGRSTLIFFFLTIGKTGYSRSRFQNPIFIFEISGKPSFVLWRVTQFFYLICSQFRQKVSGWINKTLLPIKQQKWLSEFCVKIDRVASKN
jgi:hypothetical protein